MLVLALDTVGLLNLAYLAAAVLFIFGLKLLSRVDTAARGNLVSALGMLLATATTFFYLSGGQLISLVWIAAALALGAGIGLYLALRVPMTGMPEMVALLNGFGGIASLLVASGDYFTPMPEPGSAEAAAMIAAGRAAEVAAAALDGGAAVVPTMTPLLATGLAILVGGITFTGSLVAFAKLSGVAPRLVPDQPVQFTGQKALIGLLTLAGLALSGVLAADHTAWWVVPVIAALALALGVLLVIGIGGADMPVIISLLNSYSGIAAAMAGFVLQNFALIITGSLVGASGIILTSIMCKAMNRSLLNVLFGGGGGAGAAAGGTAVQGEARSSGAEDAAIVMDAASSVVIVPGYGMAVAQAQHAVKDLADALAKKSVQVTYAIHPVAGRMPGHMNVLLAEAGVPYEQLLDLEQSNAQLQQADVALVIGANDVTNPAARTDTASPLYGMPILDVDHARTVFVIKRSLNPGFAGVQNSLYFLDNTRMVFGDAKKVVSELLSELGEI